ncbi:hypothetical protein N7532_005685 [Penicillium argentinense]|uniref:RING-type domain-containing protein n=1 Tax=Penicillium argentinense TaxID=1131581 RepID=A0A9W9KA21_9EURO|nr:uncharacterized protein N7532_005685 [Penicillium argentinense]KAJ5098684.1 hypothetical protein N7532_005685 [Penicillium argentinense]
MNDETGVQVMGARSKRTHRQMSQDNFSRRSMSQDSTPSDGPSQSQWLGHFYTMSEHLDPDDRPSRLPRIRTSRDRLDLLSPDHAAAQADTVIDLTDEPETPPRPGRSHGSHSRAPNTGRLPRFGRNILDNDIVDLDGDDDDDDDADLDLLSDSQGPPRGPGPSSSPEVQFVGATTRRQPLLPSRPPWGNISHGFQSSSSQLSNRSIFSHLPRLPLDWSSFGTIPGLLSRGYNSSHVEIETLPIGDALFSMPEHLDYGAPAFAMGSQPHEATRRRDTYKPPSPAPEGFARTLGEEDMAVCPNCDWELGTGEGKRQEIWVAKPCGHVYCGECAENRSLSKAKKAQGSQRTKPFSKCQVDDCGKLVSAPTAMIHLYL